MSHQPFPKKGTNLIKNTGSLKDSQVTCSPRSPEHNAERSASRVRRARNPNILDWLVIWDQTQMPLGTELPAQNHSSLQGCKSCWRGMKRGTKRGTKAAQQAERGKVNAGGRKREEKADLGCGNKPRADTGSREFLQRLSWLQTQRESNLSNQ